MLALTLSDLRRLASATLPPRLEDWDGRMIGRLAAVPDQAEPLQRGRLLAALSVGNEIIHLRHMAPSLGAAEEFAAGDPFVRSGVVRDWRIREWAEATPDP